MVGVTGSSLRSVEKCHQDDSLVYLQFVIQLEAVTILHGVLQPVEGLAVFGDPIDNPIVDSGAVRKCSFEIGKSIHGPELVAEGVQCCVLSEGCILQFTLPFEPWECLLTNLESLSILIPPPPFVCLHCSAVIASAVSTVCQQVKVLSDFLVEIIRFGGQCENADSAKPTLPYTPSAVLQGLLTFCIKYRVISLDRILLSLLMRSCQSPVEIAAVHSVFFFVFSQSSELRLAIKKISEVGSARPPTSDNADVDGAKRRSLPCPSLISSSRWQDLLNFLHSIIPEQSVQLPGMDEPEIRQPRMPVYFDHLLLRLLPILEIFFTSCLDNPPPLLQLARFCNIVSPLMLLHHRPVNLSFILLRGQFQQFGSPIPINATLPKVLSFRKSNLVDKVCCQLIIRTLLHEHQQLAVCTNRTLRRDCAMRFADLGVSGLFSPPAWNHLESVFNKAVAKAEAAFPSPTYSDADIAACLRTTAQVTEQELHLAQEIDQSAGAWHPTAEYMFALLSPIVASEYRPLVL
nr:unnamed protein product [Spirometra erinaceieuropaei]